MKWHYANHKRGIFILQNEINFSIFLENHEKKRPCRDSRNRGPGQEDWEKIEIGFALDPYAKPIFIMLCTVR